MGIILLTLHVCGQWLILHYRNGSLSPWPLSFVVLLFGSPEAPGPWNSFRVWPQGCLCS